jgi:hypothetical protein
VLVVLLLLLAWIGWAIYVANENGASAGLGVMILDISAGSIKAALVPDRRA